MITRRESIYYCCWLVARFYFTIICYQYFIIIKVIRFFFKLLCYVCCLMTTSDDHSFSSFETNFGTSFVQERSDVLKHHSHTY